MKTPPTRRRVYGLPVAMIPLAAIEMRLAAVNAQLRPLEILEAQRNALVALLDESVELPDGVTL